MNHYKHGNIKTNVIELLKLYINFLDALFIPHLFLEIFYLCQLSGLSAILDFLLAILVT